MHLFYFLSFHPQIWASSGGSCLQRLLLCFSDPDFSLQCGRPKFDPRFWKIPWRRKWQPTPVLLPGESHGWKSLVGYNPWGRKESDTTEQLHFTPPHSFCIFDNYLVKFTYDFSRSICTESNIIMIFFLLLLQTQYKFNTKSQRYTG